MFCTRVLWTFPLAAFVVCCCFLFRLNLCKPQFFCQTVDPQTLTVLLGSVSITMMTARICLSIGYEICQWWPLTFKVCLHWEGGRVFHFRVDLRFWEQCGCDGASSLGSRQIRRHQWTSIISVLLGNLGSLWICRGEVVCFPGHFRPSIALHCFLLHLRGLWGHYC